MIELLECEGGGPARCPVCSTEIGWPRPTTWCKTCRTPHHLECWAYNGGTCAVYGGDPRRSPLVIEDDDPMPFERWGPAGSPMAPVAAIAAMAVIMMLCALLGH